MSWLDVVIAVPLLWALYKGYTEGVILQLGGIVGLLIGVWLAFRYGRTLGLMLKLEPGVPFMHIVFEVVSALGTVGSSLGITPDLSTGGKIVISLTMFVGRVGLMTLLACFVRRQEQPLYTYPDDTLIL